MGVEAEGEEEAPQLPPPGRRATRSGQGKGEGGADGPSPLGVRVKEEGDADGGDGGSPDAAVLCALQQAAARADAELAWLSAGKNLLDGRYSCFGYTVDGAESLRALKVGDIIQYTKVTSGLDKLAYQ
jgi:cyclophilin family peptidyl-prolyl cis-trans isomerase